MKMEPNTVTTKTAPTTAPERMFMTHIRIRTTRATDSSRLSRKVEMADMTRSGWKKTW